MPEVVSLVSPERFTRLKVDLPEEWRFHFLDPAGEDELIAACRGADFLLARSGFSIKITRRVIENAHSLKLIQMDGVGCDTVDLEAAARCGIPVANNAGQNAGAVAEHTIGLLIALQRCVPVADREIKKGAYGQIREQLLAAGLKEIRDCAVGLVGLGAIGRETARLVHAMGAKVSYFDLFRASGEVEAALQAEYKTLDELLAESDVISMHVPLTEKTRDLIGRREFGRLRPGALFINTARGEVVDQAALAEALESGRLGGAALDTLSPEPPPPDHPLLNLSPAARDRLLLTPHVAGLTVGAARRMLLNALENMARVARGDAPHNIVNRL